MIKNILKKIIPSYYVDRIRVYRKNKRFAKRFLYNNGEVFFKKIETLGVSFEILLNPFLNSGVDEAIAEFGYWEPKVAEQIKKILSAGGTFIDIGANIGYHSLLAAKILGDKGRVYSFEPQDAIYHQFMKSLAKNNLKNVTVYNTALSDHSGGSTLYIREENSGGSTLLKLPNMESFHVDSSLEVSLVVLDSYVDRFSLVDLIKIDVEGHEYEVFKGGQKLLSTYHPTIIMEFSPVFYIQDYAHKAEDLIDFLKTLGYTFFDMSEKPIDLNLWLQVGSNRTSQIDVICKYKFS